MIKRRKENRRAIMLRLPNALAREIEKMALKEDRSITKVVQKLIEQQLRGKQNE